MNRRGHRRHRASREHVPMGDPQGEAKIVVGLLYEPDAPDVRCQQCGYQLRRDKRGHLMHVTHEGHYIYIDHKPVPPQPKEQ